MVLSGYLLCKWGFLWGFEFAISKMIGNLYPQNSEWEEQCEVSKKLILYNWGVNIVLVVAYLIFGIKAEL